MEQFRGYSRRELMEWATRGRLPNNKSYRVRDLGEGAALVWRVTSPRSLAGYLLWLHATDRRLPRC